MVTTNTIPKWTYRLVSVRRPSATAFYGSLTTTCDTGVMRALLFLAAAVLFGLTGGYAWSQWSKPSPAQTVMAQAQAIPSANPGQTKAEIEDSVYFADCDAAKAAGREPLYEGQPGFRKELDPDGDGMACIPTS